MATKQELLLGLFEPVVQALGCELWGLEYMNQGGKHTTLRIYIDRFDGDKNPGVSLDDCEQVSRQLAGILDVEDPISGEYTLEVSSPGLDRPLYNLDQYKRFVGSQVAIRLRMAFEGRRNFTGQLSGVEDQDVVVVVDKHEYLLPVDWIEKAKVVPQF